MGELQTKTPDDKVGNNGVMKSPVDFETAQKEVTAWLDSKRIRESRREKKKEQFNDLVAAIQEGILTYNPESNELKHKLIFPEALPGGDTITYKHRVSTLDVERHLKGVPADDPDGRLHAWICALTDQPRNVVRRMDTEDLTIAQSVAVFFL